MVLLRSVVFGLAAATLMSCAGDSAKSTANPARLEQVAEFRRLTAGTLTEGPPLSDEDIVRSAEAFCVVALSADSPESFASAISRLSDGYFLSDVGQAVEASLRLWCPSEFDRLLSDDSFWVFFESQKSAIELGEEARAAGPSRAPTQADRDVLEAFREALRGSNVEELPLMADLISAEDLVLLSEIHCLARDLAGSTDNYLDELQTLHQEDPYSAQLPFGAVEELVTFTLFLYCP